MAVLSELSRTAYVRYARGRVINVSIETVTHIILCLKSSSFHVWIIKVHVWVISATLLVGLRWLLIVVVVLLGWWGSITVVVVSVTTATMMRLTSLESTSTIARWWRWVVPHVVTPTTRHKFRKLVSLVKTRLYRKTRESRQLHRNKCSYAERRFK